MSVGTYPQIPLTAYTGPSSSARTINIMIGISLALHVLALLLIAGLRLPGKMERPLAAYEISLVTMPTASIPPAPAPVHPVEPPAPKTPEPPVTQPAPPPVVKETAPPPPQPVRLAPTPHVRPLEPIPPKPTAAPPQPKVQRDSPPPAPVPPPVVRPSEAKAPSAPVPPPVRPVINRDPLRGIALPSEVPKLGQVDPIPAGTQRETRSQAQAEAQKAQAEMQKILNNLNVPESAPMPTQQTPTTSTRTTQQRSVSEEVNRLLEQPVKVEPPKTAPMTEPRVASKPAMRTPVRIQSIGETQGNPYLALVQKRISEHWVAPQVGMTGEYFRVIIKFRLDKTGKVSNLEIEEKSGNEYYDMAAKRAVQAAAPLPAFFPDMSQLYFDTHFSFAVGEPVS